MRALVVAGAPCVFDDARAALACGGFDAYYVVNGAAMHWPLADWWVTWHPEAVPRWRREREAGGWPIPPIISSPHPTRPKEPVSRWIEARWPEQPKMMLTSTYLAVKAALEDGAERVVICGAPLDVAGGNADPDLPQDHDYRRYRPAFAWAADHVFAGRVRAASGYLADLLGAPDREWMAC